MGLILRLLCDIYQGLRVCCAGVVFSITLLNIQRVLHVLVSTVLAHIVAKMFSNLLITSCFNCATYYFFPKYSANLLSQ